MKGDSRQKLGAERAAYRRAFAKVGPPPRGYGLLVWAHRLIAAAEAEARRRAAEADRARYLASLARAASKISKSAHEEQAILDEAARMDLQLPTGPGDSDPQAQLVLDRVRNLCADVWRSIAKDDAVEYVETRRANVAVLISGLGAQPSAIYLGAARRALEGAAGLGGWDAAGEAVVQ